MTIALIYRLVPASPPGTRRPIDWTGAVLLALGLTAPLVAISESGRWGWGNGLTLGPAAVGLVVLVLFVRIERRHPDPLVHVPTLLLRRVWMTNAATAMVAFGQIGAFLLVPEIVQRTRGAGGVGLGRSPLAAGAVIVPACLFLAAGALLGGRVADRLGGRMVMVLGSAGTAVGMLLLALRHGAFLDLATWAGVAGLGSGMALAAAPILITAAVPPGEVAEANGISTVARNIGSGLGAQLPAAFIAGATVVGAGGVRFVGADHGFTLAFLWQAIGVLGAMAVAAAIPRRGRAFAVAVAPVP